MKRFLHIAVTIAAIVFLLWFLAPIAFDVRNVGNMLGILLCAALIFRFGFSKRYASLKRRLCRRKLSKLILRVVQIGASAFVIYSVVVSGFMIYAMTVKPSGNDTAVILGAQVKPWGASQLLQQRIDAAQRYLEDHPGAKAVATGGQGADEPMSEGQCIYDSLTASGISPDRVIIEDKATNTEQNIRYSTEKIKENGLNTDIAVVTDSYHQLRARIIAHKIDGTVRVSAVNTQNNYVGLAAYPTYFVREWIAIPVEILK